MTHHLSSQPHTYITRGSTGCALAARSAAVAVVVDALRASTTITALLDHGVERVLVVAGVEDARVLATEMPDALLVGERGAERLPGFDLGNSPLEVMASPRMDGRTAIFTSSNGAQRLTACGGAEHVVVGTVANAQVLTEWSRQAAEHSAQPVVFIAAGKFPDEDYVSPEDEAASVYLAGRLGLPIAEAAQPLYDHWERELMLHGLEGIFRTSRHAQRLMEIGYCEDVFFCARPDTLTSLPVVTDVLLHDGRQIGVEVRSMGILDFRFWTGYLTPGYQ